MPPVRRQGWAQRLRRARDVLLRAARAWSEDQVPTLGAALAYYTLFSIAPLLLIVISVAGLVFGEQAARGEIMGQLTGLIGADGAQAVEALLQRVRRPEDSGWAALLGLAVLLVGATSVFAELQNALDRIWDAGPHPEATAADSLWDWLRRRLLSLGLILGLGFLSMVSMVFSALLAALGRWWSPLFEGWLWLAEGLNVLLSFALMTAMFAALYKWVPRVALRWRDVGVGALITAALFTLGKSLIGLYLGRSGLASAYGAAASLAVLMLWVYYSAQVFLFGAELSWAYARRHDGPAGPSPGR